MSRPLTTEEMVAGDPRRILMEEALSRHPMHDVYFSDKPGFTCPDHSELAQLGVYITLIAQVDCQMCHGEDDFRDCHDFCPVCEFCCGC